MNIRLRPLRRDKSNIQQLVLHFILHSFSDAGSLGDAWIEWGKKDFHPPMLRVKLRKKGKKGVV